MRRRKTKIRIIVSPLIPRKMPYSITKEQINQLMKEARPKIKSVIYVGWARRKIDGKRRLLYLMATGSTSPEARKTFKTSENFGEDIWLIE